MKADLHMHSTHSDGLLTTKELFMKAQENGVDIIAITDHDTCLNVEDNIRLSKEFKVKYLPAIELSTIEQERSVHILGYFRDDSYNSIEMKDYYKRIKTKREKRARKFITNLKTFFDLDVDYNDAYNYGKGIIARPHIAKAIMKKYPEYSHNYIFDNFIGDHSPAYVPSSLLTVQEGLDLLRRNNCVAVLAHPILLKKHIKENVLNHKFDGVEAVYYQNNDGDEERFRKYASDNDLIITAGSDFHGIKNDSKHGEVGEITLTGKDLDIFLSKIQ